jgi:transmembrane sensor
VADELISPLARGTARFDHELAEELADAREHLDPDFGGLDVERGLIGLSHKVKRQRQRRQASWAAAGLCALLLVSFAAFRARDQALLGERSAASDTLQTQDGSLATRLSAETELRLEHDARDEVALALVRGKGHFKVTPNKHRRYRVRAGEVEVQVLGTAFEVERLGARSRVRVEHGVVRVSWPGGERVLHAGEQGVFPQQPLAAATSVQIEQQPSAAPAPEQLGAAEADDAALALEPAHKAPARERWRVLARAGKHEEAFGSLGHQPVDDLAGLLLAADAARLSGHPRAAARYLERLIDRYPESAPAHLAAFTLGRLALYELKRPALAARSFARAYTLNAAGPLAEDALAREAEAYHRAGDAERAKNAAERYLERYPNGARKAEVARYVDRAPVREPTQAAGRGQ